MSTDAVKTCSKCGESKPVGMFRKIGRRCKQCIADYQRKYQSENRAQIAEKKRAYREANQEKERSYIEANRIRIAEKHRQWVEKNRDKLRHQARKRRKEDPEKYRERDLKRRKAQPEKIIESRRRYLAKSKAKTAARNKRHCDELTDCYVVHKIVVNTTLTRADIPPELLEAKRLQLKLKRIAMEAMK